MTDFRRIYQALSEASLLEGRGGTKGVISEWMTRLRKESRPFSLHITSPITKAEVRGQMSFSSAKVWESVTGTEFFKVVYTYSPLPDPVGISPVGDEVFKSQLESTGWTALRQHVPALQELSQLVKGREVVTANRVGYEGTWEMRIYVLLTDMLAADERG